MSDPPAEPEADLDPADRGLRASVVIPVRGGLDRLATTLAAVAGQDLSRGDFEVIVVDDGTPAGEGDVEAIARAAAPTLRLRVLRQEPAGPAAARNRGIDAAEAPIVALLDADVLPRADWLRRGLEPFDGSHPPAAVEGRTVVEPAAERTPFTHQTDNRDGGRYPTCNLLIDKRWIDSRGIRFDERYTMAFREDSDFAFQILASGGEILWCPEVEVVHPPVPRGWTTPWKLAKRYEMDGLLTRRFFDRWQKLDRRLGIPHFRITLYSMAAFGQFFAVVVLLQALAFNDLATLESIRFAAACVVFSGLLPLLVLVGPQPTLRTLPLLPQAALVSLLVPWPFVSAAARGWWRFRGVEHFHPRTVDDSGLNRRRSADTQPPASAGGSSAPPV